MVNQYLSLFQYTKRWMYSHLVYISKHFTDKDTIHTILVKPTNMSPLAHTHTRKVTQFSQAFIHTSDEQYVDCKSTKKIIALTGLTHEKEEKHLHLSSKYIHDN